MNAARSRSMGRRHGPRPLRGLGASDQQKSLVSTGASTGATVGSVFPVVGTAIGAVIGAVVGLIGAAFVGTRRPESDLWDNYKKSAGNATGHEYDNQFRNGAFVELMRFGKNTFPPRAKGGYGPKDDAKFMSDMFAKIGQAFDAGVLGANETPASIYSKVVGPWIAQWGEEKSPDWARWEKQILVDQIDAWMFDQPTIATSYTSSTWAQPRISDIAAKIVARTNPPPSVLPTPSGGVTPIVTPLPTAPAPTTPGQLVTLPTSPVPAPTLPMITPSIPGAGGVDISALVSSMLAQGKSQQDTFTSALNALSNAGVAPTAEVQAQVADVVKSGGTSPWIKPALIAGGAVVLFMMFKKKRGARK